MDVEEEPAAVAVAEPVVEEAAAEGVAAPARFPAGVMISADALPVAELLASNESKLAMTWGARVAMVAAAAGCPAAVLPGAGRRMDSVDTVGEEIVT